VSKKTIGRMLVLWVVVLPLCLFGNYSGLLAAGLLKVFPTINFNYSTPLCKRLSCPGNYAPIDKGTDFIVEEYRAATQEIKTRLEQEHLLFGLNFVLTGAVFGIVFRYYPARVFPAKGNDEEGKPIDEKYSTIRSICLCSWAAVGVCSIVDVRLQFNSRIITDIGSWIRECLEPCLVRHPVLGWETYFSGIGLPKDSPFSSILNGDRPLLTALLYLFSIYLFIYLPKFSRGFDSNVSRDLFAIAKIALPVCTILFGWSRLYFYFDMRWVNYIYAILVVAIAVVVRLCVSSLARLDLATSA
jgi:hypothetical protein